jgi:quinoprotein glucose dehydrogenase
MSRVSRVLLAVSLVPAVAAGQAVQTAGWPVTEGAPGGGRYSPLADINTSNVGQLEQAWVYRYGADDAFDGSFPVFRGTSQETTPILVDGRLILTTPTNRVIALDPEQGTELWTFDPGLLKSRWYANMWTNRGVAAWQGGTGDACAPRVFLTTLGQATAYTGLFSRRACSRSRSVRTSMTKRSAALLAAIANVLSHG